MNKPQKSYAAQPCAWCLGTGERGISAGYVISCLVCGGKGHLMIPQPAEQCRQCEGSGKRNIANSCLTCAGTGWSRVFRQG